MGKGYIQVGRRQRKLTAKQVEQHSVKGAQESAEAPKHGDKVAKVEGHRGDVALDAWGTALRDMAKAGVDADAPLPGFGSAGKGW